MKIVWQVNVYIAVSDNHKVIKAENGIKAVSSSIDADEHPFTETLYHWQALTPSLTQANDNLNFNFQCNSAPNYTGRGFDPPPPKKKKKKKKQMPIWTWTILL